MDCGRQYQQVGGASDRRWVVLADDGAAATLGRATGPTETELAVEKTPVAGGRGCWLAIQSRFAHGPKAPNFMVVRCLGDAGGSCPDTVNAAMAEHARSREASPDA